MAGSAAKKAKLQAQYINKYYKRIGLGSLVDCSISPLLVWKRAGFIGTPCSVCGLSQLGYFWIQELPGVFYFCNYSPICCLLLLLLRRSLYDIGWSSFLFATLRA